MNEIRTARSADVEEILRLAVATDLFDADEVDPVRELALRAVDDGESARGVVIDSTSGLDGVALFDAKTAADGVWDLTMIAVNPTVHGSGIGRALVARVEAELASLGARLLIVETSSGEGFDRARRFYESASFLEEARVRDYWSEGDDLVLFTKRLR